MNDIQKAKLSSVHSSFHTQLELLKQEQEKILTQYEQALAKAYSKEIKSLYE